MSAQVAIRPVRATPEVRWRLSRRARKAVLTVHLTSSVGWIGADIGLLVLGIVANVSGSPRTGQSAVVGMNFLATWASAPLSVLALLSGVALALATRWGLFRHAWVVVSLALNAVMVVLVLFSLVPGMRDAADQVLAASASRTPAQVLGGGAPRLLVPPSVAFVVLTFVNVINVYKPWSRKR